MKTLHLAILASVGFPLWSAVSLAGPPDSFAGNNVFETHQAGWTRLSLATNTTIRSVEVSPSNATIGILLSGPSGFAGIFAPTFSIPSFTPSSSDLRSGEYWVYVVSDQVDKTMVTLNLDALVGTHAMALLPSAGSLVAHRAVIPLTDEQAFIPAGIETGSQEIQRENALITFELGDYVGTGPAATVSWHGVQNETLSSDCAPGMGGLVIGVGTVVRMLPGVVRLFHVWPGHWQSSVTHAVAGSFVVVSHRSMSMSVELQPGDPQYSAPSWFWGDYLGYIGPWQKLPPEVRGTLQQAACKQVPLG